MTEIEAGSGAEAIYELLTLAITVRGGTLNKRHEPGLRMLAIVTAREVVRRDNESAEVLRGKN